MWDESESCTYKHIRAHTPRKEMCGKWSADVLAPNKRYTLGARTQQARESKISTGWSIWDESSQEPVSPCNLYKSSKKTQDWNHGDLKQQELETLCKNRSRMWHMSYKPLPSRLNLLCSRPALPTLLACSISIRSSHLRFSVWTLWALRTCWFLYLHQINHFSACSNNYISLEMAPAALQQTDNRCTRSYGIKKGK